MQHWLNEGPREGPWNAVARLGDAADSKRVDPKGKMWYEDTFCSRLAVATDPYLCRLDDLEMILGWWMGARFGILYCASRHALDGQFGCVGLGGAFWA